MNRLLAGLAVVAVVALAGCSDDEPSGGDTVTVTSDPGSAAGTTQEATESTAPVDVTTEEPTEATTIEGTERSPLVGLRGGDDALSNEGDVGQYVTDIVEQTPAEGTIEWGQDGCLWAVYQGVWVLTGTCRVPDVSAANIEYWYPYGMDPTTSWFFEVATDPTVTANSAYIVFLTNGGQYWTRCSGTCDASTIEIYDGTQWLTAQQVTDAAAQQTVTQAASAGASAIVGGGNVNVVDINQTTVEDQITAGAGIIGGDPYAGMTDNEAFMQALLNKWNNDIAGVWTAPNCTASYNGC